MLSYEPPNDPAFDIAQRLLSELPGITHVKLQNLCFYCYGYLTAIAQTEEIPFDAWQHGPVREHFARKTAHGAVELPEPLVNSWSLRLDGLPVPRFESFHDAATAYRSVR